MVAFCRGTVSVTGMKRDSDATRARLLAAAREEFAAHGIAGGRVDRIAVRAGVNKQRIYGHFGSKELLFQAVMTEALKERTEALGVPTGDLSDFVGRMYDFHRDHPELLRLYLWEALYYGPESLVADDPRTAAYSEKVDALAADLGVDDRRHVSALLLALIGMGAWPHAVPQLTKLIYKDDDPGNLRHDLVELARQMIKSQ
jgi:AcrR family transcriptional regulator